MAQLNSHELKCLKYEREKVSNKSDPCRSQLVKRLNQLLTLMRQAPHGPPLLSAQLTADIIRCS